MFHLDFGTAAPFWVLLLGAEGQEARLTSGSTVPKSFLPGSIWVQESGLRNLRNWDRVH